MTLQNSGKSNWRGRIFRYAPLILWIGIILFASSGQASMSKTSRFIGPFLDFLFPSVSEETKYLLHHYIRKLAHLWIYFVLALWAYRVFANSSVRILSKHWFLSSIVLVALIAAIDEVHQSFDASRAGSAWDVLLDVCGGAAFLLIAHLYRKWQNRFNKIETMNKK